MESIKARYLLESGKIKVTMDPFLYKHNRQVLSDTLRGYHLYNLSGHVDTTSPLPPGKDIDVVVLSKPVWRRCKVIHLDKDFIYIIDLEDKEFRKLLYSDKVIVESISIKKDKKYD